MEVMSEPVDSYRDTIIISNSYFTDNTIDIITPVLANDEVIGLIRSNLSIQYFSTFLSDSNNSFLIDNEGNYLFGYDASSDDDKLFFNYTAKLRIDMENKTTSLSDTTSANSSNVFSDSRKYIYGYAVIPEYNWIYAIKRDSSDYTGITPTLPVIFIVLLLIVVVLAIQTKEKPCRPIHTASF